MSITVGTVVQADGRRCTVVHVSPFAAMDMDDLEDELELVDQETGETLYRYVSEVTV